MLQPRRICIDHHSVPWHLGTGGKDLAPVILHHAHATGAVGGQFRMITEGMKINTGFTDDRKYIFVFIKCNFSIVDGHIFHSLSASYASMWMAPNAQALSPAPHLIHLELSITYGSLIFPLIAPTGQFLAHLEQ